MATVETVSNLSNLLKEVWTQDRLERQFYDGTRFLDRVEKTNKYSIGRQAQVPIESSLPGGTSTFLAAGGTLNASDALHVARADYTLSYVWQQVQLQAAALGQADSVGVRSTVDALDQTVQSNVLALRKDINRQSVSNGDALIAQCTTTSTNNTVQLLASGYGYDAIVRGWLRPGQVVDIGTTANETAILADATITAVSEVAATPTITVASGTPSTTSSHYVSIANARAGATSNETNGLRTIAGSTSTTIGGIAGGTYWQPASVDTSTTLVSLDLLLSLQRSVYQKSAQFPKFVTTSPKQQANLYSLFQNQVRFSSDSPKAGNVGSFEWNGIEISVDPDVPDRELYMLTLDDFLVVTDGQFGKPTWMSDIEGAGGRLRWVQGSTKLADALVYPLQVAIKRRNSHAAAIGLTA